MSAAAATFTLSFVITLGLTRPGLSASTTTPSIVVPPKVVALSANLTVPVGSTAILRFKYQHPEDAEEENIYKTVYALHKGRQDFCELSKNVTACYGEFQGRAVLKDNEEEGELTLILPEVQHTDEGSYEAEVRVKFHPHGTPANAKMFLHVIDKPGCPALMCPGSNVSICRMENISTDIQPHGLLACSCECTEWKQTATGLEVSALGVGLGLGMLLMATLFSIPLAVSIIKGCVVLQWPPSMTRDGLTCPLCPAREVTQSVNFSCDDEGGENREGHMHKTPCTENVMYMS